MKRFLILIVAILFTLAVSAQQAKIDYPDSGFTSKSEAKNLMINGKKEGKWIEYIEQEGGVLDTNYKDMAIGYNLTVYIGGEPFGIQREYICKGMCNTTKSGILFMETPYKDGKRNGIGKMYNQSEASIIEIPYVDGKISGIEKYYDANGKILKEYNFTDYKWTYYDTNCNEIK
jgi:antitoxin component YwqK of YwqJK toxin-antitoxin module